jgi:hypothetical protein
MTTLNIEKYWLDTYERLSDQAVAFRDSQSVSFGLLAIYDKLSESEKPCVHRVLAEWLVSEDNKSRYDASFLISERRIIEMKSAIEKSIMRAKGQTGSEAMDEVDDLRRILAELENGSKGLKRR